MKIVMEYRCSIAQRGGEMDQLPSQFVWSGSAFLPDTYLGHRILLVRHSVVVLCNILACNIRIVSFPLCQYVNGNMLMARSQRQDLNGKIYGNLI